MEFILSLIYCRLLCFPLSPSLSLTLLPHTTPVHFLSLQSLSTISLFSFRRYTLSPLASEFHGNESEPFGV